MMMQHTGGRHRHCSESKKFFLCAIRINSGTSKKTQSLSPKPEAKPKALDFWIFYVFPNSLRLPLHWATREKWKRNKKRKTGFDASGGDF